MAGDCGAAASGSNSKNSKEALGIEETISAISPPFLHLYSNYPSNLFLYLSSHLSVHL